PDEGGPQRLRGPISVQELLCVLTSFYRPPFRWRSCASPLRLAPNRAMARAAGAGGSRAEPCEPSPPAHGWLAAGARSSLRLGSSRPGLSREWSPGWWSDLAYLWGHRIFFPGRTTRS